MSLNEVHRSPMAPEMDLRKIILQDQKKVRLETMFEKR